MPSAGKLCSCWGGRVLPLLLAYVCYLLLGATVFQLLEKQAEAQSRDQFQFEKLRFLENYTCLDQRALEQFVQVIMEAWVKGVNPKGNSTNPSNWDFGSSFFFAGTVVTTIGYGNLAPSTEAGQVFCVFYALVGIPLNVVFLNHLGAGLHAHLAALERWEEQPRRSQLLQILGLALFLTLGTLVILIFPPMVFSHVEGWSFGEGFYFAFITLSTIGFGDYVVGMDPSRRYPLWYKNTVSLWILFGMAWLALIIKLILSLLETPGRSYSCYHHSSKENFKPQSWRQSPDGEAEPRLPQSGCCPEGPVRIMQHPEPSTQQHLPHEEGCGRDEITSCKFRT
ncbi:potassium channel subfamily k member 16 [Lynx pardinus]|uniref:Potassium channel subfamily K member n=1 Tax=Lynx pardinus TaxID=191816 RepID=A0A485MEI1_LYNPA|nr:potassium channel subfamily k member 16 [Lynx pardinus]